MHLAINNLGTLGVTNAIRRADDLAGQLTGFFEHRLDQVGGCLLEARYLTHRVKICQFANREQHVFDGGTIIGHHKSSLNLCIDVIRPPGRQASPATLSQLRRVAYSNKIKTAAACGSKRPLKPQNRRQLAV